MEKHLKQLSKQISHMLRHEPWLYELELDNEGWIPLGNLIQALQKLRNAWQNISERDLLQMIEQSEKKRHEIINGRIRTLYGHSIPGKLLKQPAMPPNLLYHGTSPVFLKEIKSKGILPMSRQYVHYISVDIAIAKEVGKRKSENPIILTIKAREAYENEINFYKGNDLVWLADKIPPDFVKL